MNTRYNFLLMFPDTNICVGKTELGWTRTTINNRYMHLFKNKKSAISSRGRIAKYDGMGWVLFCVPVDKIEVRNK